VGVLLTGYNFFRLRAEGAHRRRGKHLVSQGVYNKSNLCMAMTSLIIMMHITRNFSKYRSNGHSNH